MIKVGLGQTEGIDTRKTVKSVISKCQKQLQGYQPQAGIVFAGTNFDHAVMLSEINRVFPDIELIGCTTAGELSSNYGFSDESIVLMLFYSEDIEMKAGVGRILSENPTAAINSAVNHAKSKLSKKPSICLTFPDGQNKSFEPIMKLLNRELGDRCAVFGGVAGTIWNENPRILQFHKEEILQDAIPILLWGGPLEYAFSIANSWRPIGKRVTVTEAEGRCIKRIGDSTAVDFYRHYLGDHTEPVKEFILAVYEKNKEQFYLRAPIGYNPDGSITLTETIPSGASVQLTEAIREVIIKDTETSTKALAKNAINFQPSFALAFSCAFRKEILGTRTEEELRILRENLPPQIPVSGFYTYGEIGPLVKGQESFFHGATLVTLLVGQTNGSFDGSRKISPFPSQDALPPGPIEEHRDDLLSIEGLKLETEFLRRKLSRSENYRKRLEEIKDFNATMHRTIIREVEEAREEILRKEAALRKSEVKYRRIVETAGEGFILMDENLVIVDVNEAYCGLIGLSRDEILGKTTFDLATEEFRQFLMINRNELLSKDYRKFEGAVVAADGRHVPILVHGNTLRDDRGDIIGNMAFITDMTEHKKALALAAEVQKSLLPQGKPRIQGLDVAGKNVSCDEIGGDYFDFLWRRENPNSPFSVVVGDITGHGVDSALLMTSARAFLRMRASQPGTMSDIISAMNSHLAQDVLESGRFMTLFYMTIDPGNDRIEWVRAGHDPALLYDPTEDKFEELKGDGIALGVSAAFTYEENLKTGLKEGQIIAIGTDGIWEASDKYGKMFGKDRFRDIIRQHAQANADDILNAVYGELSQFTKGMKSEDDITLVIIKMNRFS
ncbi:MAG: SpoIIE family protein phosphatase [Desulfobacterales bacterium]|jgi:PAS domain S-box-containing protein